MKASVHHDSQSNDGVGSGRGSETVCFLEPRSNPRGLLTAGSSGFDSARRLFRELREESLLTGIIDWESKSEVMHVRSGGCSLKEKNTKFYSLF